MSISVIIPAYKARKYLPECLESISRQTLQPAEVLVIDDFSPEPVDDIVAAFSASPGNPPIRLIRHEVNRGQAAGRNTGIGASNSEWLAFIDCDDVWAPAHLEQAMATLQATGADLAFCPVTIFEDDIYNPSGLIERPMTPKEESLEPLALLMRCFIIMSSVVSRTSTIRAIGGFDEDERMRAVEDLDCFMKLLQSGAKFTMSGNSTLFYRKHPESATGRPAYMAYQSAYVREIHVWNVRGNFFTKCSMVARKWWDAFRILPSGNARSTHALGHALLWSLPAPWEIVRGLVRWFRRRQAQGS